MRDAADEHSSVLASAHLRYALLARGVDECADDDADPNSALGPFGCVNRFSLTCLKFSNAAETTLNISVARTCAIVSPAATLSG